MVNQTSAKGIEKKSNRFLEKEIDQSNIGKRIEKKSNGFSEKKLMGWSIKHRQKSLKRKKRLERSQTEIRKNNFRRKTG